MRAISSYRGNRHRPPARPPQTHRQDRLQYTVPLASAQCNYNTNILSKHGGGFPEGQTPIVLDTQETGAGPFFQFRNPHWAMRRMRRGDSALSKNVDERVNTSPCMESSQMQARVAVAAAIADSQNFAWLVSIVSSARSAVAVNSWYCCYLIDLHLLTPMVDETISK